MTIRETKLNYDHAFNVGLATEFGMAGSVILSNFRHWTLINRANKNNFYDDRYWTYNTVSAFAELFPYLTKRVIRTTLDSLVRHNLIVVGNYNRLKYDRTLWYALTDFGLEKLGIGEVRTRATPHLSKTTNGATPHFTLLTNASSPNVTTIPDTIPDTDKRSIEAISIFKNSVDSKVSSSANTNSRADKRIESIDSTLLSQTRERRGEAQQDEDVTAVKKLVIEKLRDSSFTDAQARSLLNARTNDSKLATADTISESLDNYLLYLLTKKGGLVKNKLAYFIRAIKKSGFFANSTQFTAEKLDSDRPVEQLSAQSRPWRAPESKILTDDEENQVANTLNNLLSRMRAPLL